MKKRSVTTQKVISYFREQGEELTEEGAEETLDLMYFLSIHIIKRVKAILRKRERIRSRIKDILYLKKNWLRGNSITGLEPKNQCLQTKKGIFENICIFDIKTSNHFFDN